MKNVLSNLITAAFITGGVTMVSSSAFAQVVGNDLYMGFQNQAGGATKDYIINLGPASSIVGGNAVITLTSAFSLANFNTVLGSSPSMYGGVIGANNANNPSDVYLTQLRSGGAGAPSVPGSSVGSTMTRSQDNSTYAVLGTLDGPASGTGVLDSSKSWESDVEPTLTTGSFYGQTGLNPDSVVSKTNVLYEDLWFTSSSTSTGAKPYVYEGYFTLDLTGGGTKLTFTPKNAPGSLTAPVFQSIVKSGNTITLIWSTVATHTYQLQYTTTMSPTNWVNLGSSTLANFATMTNTDSFLNNTNRFYRVQAQ